MDLPLELLGQVVQEGEIYWFHDGCPKGVLGHRHVCVRHKGQVLVFGACSSRTSTALRLAEIRHEDMNTFPMFMPSTTNGLKKVTYVDCNKVFTVTEDEFGEWQANAYIERANGAMAEQDMKLLVKGVLLSTQVTEEIKDLFRE